MEYPEPAEIPAGIPAASEEMIDETMIDQNLFLDEDESPFRYLSRMEPAPELSLRDLIDKMSKNCRNFDSTMRGLKEKQVFDIIYPGGLGVPDWLSLKDTSLETVPTETNVPETVEISEETNQTIAPSIVPKRITLKVISECTVPSDCFVTLRVDGKRNDGKKFKTKTISSRDPDWDQPFVFEVENPEECFCTVKVRKTRSIGLRGSTIFTNRQFLTNWINGTSLPLLFDVEIEVKMEEIVKNLKS